MNDLIKNAFSEDLPSGDLTTDSLEISEKFGMAKVIAKQDLILSGSQCFNESLHYCDQGLTVNWYFQDGEEILKGQCAAQIDGNLINLIKAERVALNFLGYLSGIATETSKYVEACHGTTTKILDTRKTLPGFRVLAKQAVIHGGGSNHRMNLSDAIMIKENHIVLAGNMGTAIEQIRKKSDQPIEVETTNLTEVKEAVAYQVNQIMLDNMSTETMIEALKLIPKDIKTEASGNMTLARTSEVAATGVDFISVGALTHSVTNADFSMLFDWS